MPKVDFSKLGAKEEGKEEKEAKANPFAKAESNPFTKTKPEEPKTTFTKAKPKIRENVIEVETDEPKESFGLAVSKTAYSIIDVEKERPLTMQERKQKIKQTMELVEFTAKHALREDDFWLPPQSRGKKSLTRSGCNKLAAVFNITCETLNIEVKKEPKINGEEDIVAYATVKATRPNGSHVIITALKALSEYESSKAGARDPKDWVSMQFLKGTAETRAMNRAIINAIGFVPKDYITVSKEEFDISTN